MLRRSVSDSVSFVLVPFVSVVCQGLVHGEGNMLGVSSGFCVLWNNLVMMIIVCINFTELI